MVLRRHQREAVVLGTKLTLAAMRNDDEPRRWTLLEPEASLLDAGFWLVRETPDPAPSAGLECHLAVSSDDLSFKVMSTRGMGVGRGSYLGMPFTGGSAIEGPCTRSTSSHSWLPG